MPRTSKTFAKRVASIGHFLERLRLSGFPTAGAVYHESVASSVVVYHDSGEGDPTSFVNAYSNPDYIEVSYNKPLGPDGIPEALANGSDVHMMTLRRMFSATGTPNPVGNIPLSVVGHFPAPVSPLPIVLVAGVAQMTVGPVSMLGEWDFAISDRSNVVVGATAHLRFM
jgi:hypothetical protein